MTLLGPDGRPIAEYAKKMAPVHKPQVGEIAGSWSSGLAVPRSRGPVNNQLQFDTSKLRLEDYAIMSDHYQINSSITVLSFMLHQLEWKIEDDSPKRAAHYTENLEAIWTRLVRALSQAFIYGFSPNALQWENERGGNKLVITKVKDLVPQDCQVKWKKVPAAGKWPGGVAPKINIYDGITSHGNPDIPVANSLWYPLLMRNGDMYGRKLLNAAFQPWFFSNLIHMYSNRYFERFGEPTLISRAPFDEEIDVNGSPIKGNVLMNSLAGMVRNGAAVTLPNSRAMNGMDGVANYEYTMEYLESMMRGADFERYLTRLDQEISLALFTPLLMMNSGEGGSFNLGVIHTQMYMSMLNAVADDWAEYINRYVLTPMAQQNYGPNVKLPKWRFRRLGQTKEETVRTILNSLLNNGNGEQLVKVDLEDLGAEIGLGLSEVEQLREPRSVEDGGTGGGGYQDPKAKKDGAGEAGGRPRKKRDERVGRPEREGTGKGTEKKAVTMSIAQRVGAQFVKAKSSGELHLDIGHGRQLTEILGPDGAEAFSVDAAAWISALHAADPEMGFPKVYAHLSSGLARQIDSERYAEVTHAH